MNEIVSGLTQHGYWVLLFSILGRQACLPVPANLVVFVAGALAGFGKLNVAWILAVSVLAFLVADLAWYEAGRKYGNKAMRFIDGAKRTPNSSMEKLASTFHRYGAKYLLVSKFVPGLDALAAPMAGIYKVQVYRFVAFDAIGAILWTSLYATVGYCLRGQLDRVAIWATATRGPLLWLAAALLCVFAVRKVLSQFHSKQRPEAARITPDQLWLKLLSNERMLILYLACDKKNDQLPVAIPRSVRVDAQRLRAHSRRNKQITHGTNCSVVVYCSSSDQSTSLSGLRTLRASGRDQLFLLDGGLAAWRREGYPVTRNIQCPNSIGYEMYAMREIFQHSPEESADLFNMDLATVNAILERTNQGIAKSESLWNILRSHWSPPEMGLQQAPNFPLCVLSE